MSDTYKWDASAGFTDTLEADNLKEARKKKSVFFMGLFIIDQKIGAIWIFYGCNVICSSHAPCAMQGQNAILQMQLLTTKD